MTRLLLIEDEERIASVLEERLKDEHFTVDVAYDGEQGLRLACTCEFDVMVLDNILPKKSGLDVLREVRKQGKQFPIIVLSALSESSTKIELIAAGADDYLSKPFNIDELVIRLRALLRRPPRYHNETLFVDDLNLDTVSQVVRRGRSPVTLTPKEFKLLEYMMRNQDTVLSRSMILEHVWGLDDDPLSNTVDAHMSRLRGKIDIPGKRQLISTASGRGYRIGLNR